jgi:hypothetical protein
MTFKKVYFKGLKEEVLARANLYLINKAGYKVPANFCYETKKAKTSQQCQLMTTDYLAFEVIFEEDSDG